MSHQGSGQGGPPGYPPGGGHPPGGGAPPGYPPGGGGYYPPGYGGPPQGGPPGGYGGPPGYGPPHGPPGYPAAPLGHAPPPKKSNALLWVGIGCGGLLVLSIAGSVVAYFLAKQAAESGLAALSAAAASAAPPSPLAPPAGGVTDSSGAPLGGACAKAAECCRKIIQKSNAGAQAEAGCLALKQVPEASCEQPLQTYKQSAKLLGVNCD